MGRFKLGGGLGRAQGGRRQMRMTMVLYMWAAPKKAQYLVCYLKTLILKRELETGKHKNGTT